MESQPKDYQVDLLLLLSHFLRFLWSRKWVVLGIGVVSLLIAFLFGYRRTLYVYSWAISVQNTVLSPSQLARITTDYSSATGFQPVSIRGVLVGSECLPAPLPARGSASLPPDDASAKILALRIEASRGVNADSLQRNFESFVAASPIFQRALRDSVAITEEVLCNLDSVVLPLLSGLMNRQVNMKGISPEAEGMWSVGGSLADFVELMDRRSVLRHRLASFSLPFEAFSPCTLQAPQKWMRTGVFFIVSFFCLLFAYLLGEGVYYLAVGYPWELYAKDAQRGSGK